MYLYTFCSTSKEPHYVEQKNQRKIRTQILPPQIQGHGIRSHWRDDALSGAVRFAGIARQISVDNRRSMGTERCRSTYKTRRVINTVDKGRDELPTDREIDAALDIYERLRDGDTLELIPK